MQINKCYGLISKNMKKYTNHLISIFKNYKFYSFIVIFYELIFIIFYEKKYNSIYYSKNNSATNSIAIPFYLIKFIEKFIKRNNIKNICDLGFGEGKNLYYFGIKKNIPIDGIELDKYLYLKFIRTNKNINLFNADILNFNFKMKSYQLLIVNDPLTHKKDYEKLLINLHKSNFSNYIVFINLNSNKKRVIKKKVQIIYEKNFSKTRSLIIAKLIEVNSANY